MMNLMTTAVDVLAALYCATYIMALVHGWQHTDDPFWRGFVDPLSLVDWDRR